MFSCLDTMSDHDRWTDIHRLFKLQCPLPVAQVWPTWKDNDIKHLEFYFLFFDVSAARFSTYKTRLMMLRHDAPKQTAMLCDIQHYVSKRFSVGIAQSTTRQQVLGRISRGLRVKAVVVRRHSKSCDSFIVSDELIITLTNLQSRCRRHSEHIRPMYNL